MKITHCIFFICSVKLLSCTSRCRVHRHWPLTTLCLGSRSRAWTTSSSLTPSRISRFHLRLNGRHCLPSTAVSSTDGCSRCGLYSSLYERHTLSLLFGNVRMYVDGVSIGMKLKPFIILSGTNVWRLCLSNGFNLLLYGVGSKRRLIEEFRTAILEDFSHVVVNGYFPSLTLKSVCWQYYKYAIIKGSSKQVKSIFCRLNKQNETIFYMFEIKYCYNVFLKTNICCGKGLPKRQETWGTTLGSGIKLDIY